MDTNTQKKTEVATAAVQNNHNRVLLSIKSALFQEGGFFNARPMGRSSNLVPGEFPIRTDYCFEIKKAQHVAVRGTWLLRPIEPNFFLGGIGILLGEHAVT